MIWIHILNYWLRYRRFLSRPFLNTTNCNTQIGRQLYLISKLWPISTSYTLFGSSDISRDAAIMQCI